MAERTAEDVKRDPQKGDQVLTRACFVMIEDADEQNAAYRWKSSETAIWSRIYLTTVNAYRQWPIDRVIHIAQPAGTAGEEK